MKMNKIYLASPLFTEYERKQVRQVANYWDDDAYYSLDLIIDKLVEEA